MAATAQLATAATARTFMRPCAHSCADLSEHCCAEIPPTLRDLILLNSREYADTPRVGSDLLSPDTRYTGPRRCSGDIRLAAQRYCSDLLGPGLEWQVTKSTYSTQ
jgi:hypothetical protein